MSYTPLQLAEAFIQTGELEDALAALDEHLSQHPDDDAARRLRAEARARMAGEVHLQAALSDWAALRERTSDDYLRISAVQQRMGDASGAQQTIEDGLNAFPLHERLIERRLQLLQTASDFAAGLALLERLPISWRWRQWAGDFAVGAGDRSAAIRYYTESLNLFNETTLASHEWGGAIKARLLLARARCHLATGQHVTAAADYTAAVQHIPDDPMVAFYQGLLSWTAGDRSSAEQRIQAAYAAASAHLRQQMRDELAQHLAQHSDYVPLAERLM